MMDFSRRAMLSGTLAVAAAAPVAALAGRTSGKQATGAKAFSARSSDGTLLSGEIAGPDGAPEILFIHGLRQSRLSWERQWLDPQLAGFRRVRFDLRGHGDSDKPDDPAVYADVDLWADDVAAVIAAAELRKPVLVGWSLGGFVAGAYLRRHGTERVAAINLVDAVIKLSPDLLSPLAGRYAQSTGSPDLAVRTAETSDFLLACFHQMPTTVDLQRMLIVNGMTPRAVNNGFVKTKVSDLTDVFVAFDGPILLSHGVHDRLVRVEMSKRMVPLHRQSRLSIFQNSGHSPFYEEPERYGRELAAFVHSITRQA